jgi:hypothetical protein
MAIPPTGRGKCDQRSILLPPEPKATLLPRTGTGMATARRMPTLSKVCVPVKWKAVGIRGIVPIFRLRRDHQLRYSFPWPDAELRCVDARA